METTHLGEGETSKWEGSEENVGLKKEMQNKNSGVTLVNKSRRPIETDKKS